LFQGRFGFVNIYCNYKKRVNIVTLLLSRRPHFVLNIQDYVDYLNISRVIEIERLCCNNKTMNKANICFIFLSAFLMLSTWSLSNQLFSSADEPAQFINAAAVARFDVLGPSTYGLFIPKSDKSSPYVLVHVPAEFAASFMLPFCYSPNVNKNASCVKFPNLNPNKILDARTYVGRYQPVYYFVTGLPSLIFPTFTGMYLMRLTSDLLNAFFITLGIWGASKFRKYNKLMLLSFFISLTPSVIYFSSMENPNGLEMTSALSAWILGFLISSEPEDSKPWVYFIISLCTLSILRALSPYFCLLIIFTVFLCADKDTIKAILKKKAARIGALFVTISCLGSIIWVALAGPIIFNNLFVTPNYHTDFFHRLLLSFDRVFPIYSQDLAVFGWTNVSSPAFILIMWLVPTMLLILCSFLVSGIKDKLIVFLAVNATWGVPVFLQALESYHFGPWWQGRYAMPMIVGLPVLSAYVLTKSQAARIFSKYATILTIDIFLANVFCLYWVLRRLMVGMDGPLNIFSGKLPWSPFFGPAFWIIGYAIAVFCLVYQSYWRAAFSSAI
jgi:hypothetical protein